MQIQEQALTESLNTNNMLLKLRNPKLRKIKSSNLNQLLIIIRIKLINRKSLNMKFK